MKYEIVEPHFESIGSFSITTLHTKTATQKELEMMFQMISENNYISDECFSKLKNIVKKGSVEMWIWRINFFLDFYNFHFDSNNTFNLFMILQFCIINHLF